jgi:hypothetical protein
MTQEAHWPFGLAEAERLTRPASAPFAEFQESGPETVRRRERTLARRRIVTERRREQEGPMVLRLRRWREEQVTGVEVCLGARTFRFGRFA